MIMIMIMIMIIVNHNTEVLCSILFWIEIETIRLAGERDTV